jgi:hypothetical protein
MPERLDAELGALRVQWPATPDIAVAVERRLAEPPRRRRPLALRPPRRAPAWALAVLVALVGGSLAASPAARSALLDLLGLHGARVQRREPPPAPPTPPDHPGHLGRELGLGRASTLGEARAKLDVPLTVPRSLGTPDAVWLDAPAGGPVRVSLVYERRRGIPTSEHTRVAVLLTEFRAQVTPVLEKSLGAGARVERIELPDARAYLITGRPHGFAWIGPGGQVDFEDRRLAGPTLLVERDGVLLRAEGRMRHARAIALARELARG